MKTIQSLAILLVLAVLAAPAFAQGFFTETISVTNSPTNIVVNKPVSAVVIRENSANPTAVFSITPAAAGSVAVNLRAGQSYVFSNANSYGGTSQYGIGTVLGTIVATTAGPFSFVLIENNMPVQPATQPLQAFRNIVGTDDPCANPTIIPVKTKISDITATAKIVSNGGGSTVIYVCGVSVNPGGTGAANWRVQSGTGTNCATAPVNETGTYTGVLGTTTSIGFAGRAIMSMPAAADLCIAVVGGSSPTLGGFLSTITQ